MAKTKVTTTTITTETKTKTKKSAAGLTVHVVLDRSGSMQSIKHDAIGGFNTYVENLAKSNPTATLSLTIFDTGHIDTIIDNVLITAVEPLTDKTYVPRGGTPLYDAIGQVVAKLDVAKGKNKALVILTDGQENASHEYSSSAIKALLEERQKKAKWLVIYLGADQDAMAEGAKFGTQAGNTASFTRDNMRASFAVASASTMRYASGGLKSSAYTAEERKSLVSGKDKEVK